MISTTLISIRISLLTRIAVATITFVFCSFLATGAEKLNEPMIVGIDHSPPYSYKNSLGNAEGSIVTLIEQLTALSDLKVRFIFCPWARCIRLVQSGQIDMLAGLTKSTERLAWLYFIEPAMFNQSSSFGFYMLNTAEDIVTYSDLSGRVIGKLRGSKHFNQFDLDDTLITVEAPDVQSLFMLLHSGRIDAFIHIQETIAPYLNQYDPQQAIKHSSYAWHQTTKGYVVMSKLSQFVEILPRLNQSMAKISEQKSLNQFGNQ